MERVGEPQHADSDSLAGEGRASVAILRDPRTGRVWVILRDLADEPLARARAAARAIDTGL